MAATGTRPTSDVPLIRLKAVMAGATYSISIFFEIG